ACDGADSSLRALKGIETHGADLAQTFASIYVDADLAPWTGTRPPKLHWVSNRAVNGALVALDGRRHWLFQTLVQSTDDPSDVEWWRRTMHAVVGVEDLDMRVESVLTWRMHAHVAERFRRGDVFLAGDAAHQVPPIGGCWVDENVLDAHNLAWKLWAVLGGCASPELLDTYELERRPAALRDNVRQQRNALAPDDAGPRRGGACVGGAVGRRRRPGASPAAALR